MARRISSGRSRGFSGGGFKASRTSFRPSSSRHIGGYRTRYRPYRRDYFFHSLGPVGKVIYIVVVLIIYLILTFI